MVLVTHYKQNVITLEMVQMGVMRRQENDIYEERLDEL